MKEVKDSSQMASEEAWEAMDITAKDLQWEDIWIVIWVNEDLINIINMTANMEAGMSLLLKNFASSSLLAVALEEHSALTLTILLTTLANIFMQLVSAKRATSLANSLTRYSGLRMKLIDSLMIMRSSWPICTELKGRLTLASTI